MISTQYAMLDRLLKNTSDETQVIKEIRDYLKTLKTGFEPRTKQKKVKIKEKK